MQYTPALNCAQDGKKCPTLPLRASFVSDQPKLEYLKNKILNQALFSHLNMFFVTHNFALFMNQKHTNFCPLYFGTPPPKKKCFFPSQFAFGSLRDKWLYEILLFSLKSRFLVIISKLWTGPQALFRGFEPCLRS